MIFWLTGVLDRGAEVADLLMCLFFTEDRNSFRISKSVRCCRVRYELSSPSI